MDSKKSPHYKKATDLETEYESVTQSREIAPSTFTHGFAGAGAGAIASFVTCPLDVIKTVLQVQRQVPGATLKYHGVYGTMTTIIADDGIRGLYKGLGTTLLALIPNWAVYFYTYNTAKEIGIKSGFHDGPLLHMSTAMASAALTDVVTTPLWMVKTRLQTQRMTENSHKYTNTFSALAIIVREEGVLALWKGLAPQLVGIAHVAVQFPLYEHMKNKLALRKGKTKDELTAMELILASAVSKITASVAAYPHEVLRSRFQFQHSNDPQRYSSMWNAITRIFQQEGVRGFYRGMGANLLRVTPSCAITFTSYELIVRALKSQ